VVGDPQLDGRLAVVGQPDVLDRADGQARDLDAVALDELAGRDEVGGDGVAVAPAQDDPAADGDSRQQRGNSDDAFRGSRRQPSTLPPASPNDGRRQNLWRSSRG
jgi:hypothetical protein